MGWCYSYIYQCGLLWAEFCCSGGLREVGGGLQVAVGGDDEDGAVVHCQTLLVHGGGGH